LKVKHILKLVFILIITSCSHTQSNTKHSKHSHHHRFDDAKKWEKIFEDQSRDKWQKPDEVLAALKIEKNSIVADIGSATGYFPVRIAKIVDKGRVWGIDIEPNLVNFLNDRAKKENINNLFSILGTYDDPLIPEPVDHIFIVDTYHHINHRIHYLKKLKSKLKKKGKIIIIDFKKEKLSFGPKLKMKISHQDVTKEFLKAGFRLSQKIDILPHQYVLVFQNN
jgi:cyclopropane fatty-acyl-phospholipid synthase-like methyltransferase